MASKGKAIAIGAIGVGAIAALMLARKPAQAAPQKALPASKTPLRVTLATKYARLFGVPVSLVLATIRAQSSNRADAYRTNKRGGAWGYGQITLATAQDINKHAARKHWAKWDGTGKGLLDPAVNIAMTAYYLSLWWKRYKANTRGWFLAACAYVLGPGTVKKAVPNATTGKLPAPLPSNFAAVKSRLAKAIAADTYIKRALQAERAGAVVGLDILDPMIVNPVTGKPVGGDRVVAYMAGIKTPAIARETLALARKHLKNAWDKIPNIGWIPAMAGLREANRSRVKGVQDWAAKVESQVPQSGTTLTNLVKQKVALTLVQAEDALADVDSCLSDPELRFLPHFRSALASILGGIGSGIVDAARGLLGPGVLIPAGLAIGAGLLIATRRHAR